MSFTIPTLFQKKSRYRLISIMAACNLFNFSHNLLQLKVQTESLRVAKSHAGQWLNTARRVLAHVRAYLDSGQYGERRDSEQACLANLSAWRYTY